MPNYVIVYILKKEVNVYTKSTITFPNDRLKHFLKTNFNICTVIYGYNKHENRDCLVNKDLHSLGSDGSTYHDNCIEWCNKNDTCDGFTVFKGTCFFKSDACRINERGASSTVLFLKQGK